jgi:hypothetical protein
MINRSSRDSRKDVKIDLSKNNLLKRELIGLMFNLLALAESIEIAHTVNAESNRHLITLILDCTRDFNWTIGRCFNCIDFVISWQCNINRLILLHIVNIHLIFKIL